ncbi:MAG: hypothetical protein ACRDWE_02885, partial [Acidimicrobiales bacterium]
LHRIHRWLGPFDPAVFTQDLPRPVRIFVRQVGVTRAAPHLATSLLALANALRLAGWGSGRIALAKLARRLMLVWGTESGEGLPSNAEAPRGAPPTPIVRHTKGVQPARGAGAEHYGRLAAR